MNLNQPLSTQLYLCISAVCSSTGHDIFSRSRCFLPKSPKTDKIYFVNTLRCWLIFLLYFTLGTFWTLNQPHSNPAINALKAAVLLFRGHDIRARIAFRR